MMSVSPMSLNSQIFKSTVRPKRDVQMFDQLDRITQMGAQLLFQIESRSLSFSAIEIKLTRLIEMIAMFMAAFPEASSMIDDLLALIANIKESIRLHYGDDVDANSNRFDLNQFDDQLKKGTIDSKRIEEKMDLLGGMIDEALDKPSLSAIPLAFQVHSKQALESVIKAQSEGPSYQAKQISFSEEAHQDDTDLSEFAKAAFISEHLQYDSDTQQISIR